MASSKGDGEDLSTYRSKKEKNDDSDDDDTTSSGSKRVDASADEPLSSMAAKLATAASVSERGDCDVEDDGAVEKIRKYLAEKLSLFVPDAVDKPPQPKILDELSVDGIVNYIKDGKAKNIITLTGAGISTSAGIPDFRSPSTGLYANLQKYDLPYPQAIFELEFFKRNPEPFYTLARSLFPGAFKPTYSHYFIRMLQKKNLLMRHYTQNIDTLERVAGMEDDIIVEAHGTFHTAHCLSCHKEYTLEWLEEKLKLDDVPSCNECIGIVKPDIVFFGESLPEKFHTCAQVDFKKCDLLIIMGTSLEVQPFASLIDRVNDKCPRLLINREKAGNSDRLVWLLGMQSGLHFDSEDNYRDVFWAGDCDDGCLLLADKLGWGEELRNTVKEEHERIEKEIKMKKEEDLLKTRKGRVSKNENEATGSSKK
ncbi:hypothetical protein LSTR_LSTR009123 [Laodelphax striatellus]|uniref:Deacetylase sirtuin-type domain-containing protein n=1 Tax=Laodelphax striatellus TaxID=195883 RepID=A0A482XP39_LAOST|nr:hypothetical protein LSTR_LSTR009123 [Laodelphax striatellus]